LSEAEAVTVRVPPTVAPLAGDTTETVGGAVSGALFTVTPTAALVAVFPDVSLATAVKEWLLFDSVAVFRE